MLSTNLKKQKAEQKAAARRKSDLILYKLMITFIIGVIGIFGMLAIGSSLQAQASFRTYVLPALLVVSGLAFAAAVVFFALQRSRHVDESEKIITSANMLGAAAVLFFSSLYYQLSSSGVQQVVIFFICAVVLYFVYNIFHADFFLCSVVAAMELNLIWLSMISGSTAFGKLVSTACMVFSLAIPVIAAVFAIFLHANKGMVGKTKLLGKGDHIYPILVISVVALVGAVLAVAAPAMAGYAVIALLVVYLAIAVAYTVRMM